MALGDLVKYQDFVVQILYLVALTSRSSPRKVRQTFIGKKCGFLGKECGFVGKECGFIGKECGFTSQLLVKFVH